MTDCLFCKIANGVYDSATIFESQEFRVILDKFPSGKAHTLILTKEHFTDIYEIDSETAGKLFALTTVVARAIKKVTGCDGLNILQNNGAAAGQTVMHFHVHLIPRYKDDGLSFQWPTQSFTDEEMQRIAKEIAQQI